MQKKTISSKLKIQLSDIQSIEIITPKDINKISDDNLRSFIENISKSGYSLSKNALQIIMDHIKIPGRIMKKIFENNISNCTTCTLTVNLSLLFQQYKPENNNGLIIDEMNRRIILKSEHENFKGL